MNLMLLIGLAAAAGAILVLVGLLTTAAADRRAVYRSLRAMPTSQIAGTDVRRQQLALPALQRVIMPALNRVAAGARRFTPAGVVERLDHDLVYAGASPTWSGDRILALKVVLTAILGVGGFVLPGLLGVGAARGIILGPLLGFVGYYAPEWVLRSRVSARQHRIRRMLPDALDLLSITVAAGLGFDAAMERVAREMRGPLGEEMIRTVQEMRLGASRSEALRALGDRTNVDELRSFVLAMVQADIFGISVSRVLTVQAGEIRLKRRQAAEEQAQKLPVKIVFPLILCIFPALFVVLLGPAALTIYDQMLSQ